MRLNGHFASTRPGYVEGQDNVDDVEERGLFRGRGVLDGWSGRWSGTGTRGGQWPRRGTGRPTRSPQMSCSERVVVEALGAERAVLLLERHVGPEVGVERRGGKHLIEEISHPAGADDRRVGMSWAMRCEDGDDVGSLRKTEGYTGEPEMGMAVESSRLGWRGCVGFVWVRE